MKIRATGNLLHLYRYTSGEIADDSSAKRRKVSIEVPLGSLDNPEKEPAAGVSIPDEIKAKLTLDEIGELESYLEKAVLARSRVQLSDLCDKALRLSHTLTPEMVFDTAGLQKCRDSISSLNKALAKVGRQLDATNIGDKKQPQKEPDLLTPGYRLDMSPTTDLAGNPVPADPVKPTKP